MYGLVKAVNRNKKAVINDLEVLKIAGLVTTKKGR